MTVTDLLGHGVFGFVQADMRGNLAVSFDHGETVIQYLTDDSLQGVRTRYEATPSQSTTL